MERITYIFIIFIFLGHIYSCGYLALCKAQFLPAWRRPGSDNSTVITRDFTVTGTCNSFYILEPINYQTVSIVDDPYAGLFSVGVDYNLLQETVSCDPTLVPAQSTSYTLVLRAHGSNGVTADVSMTINHVPPSNNNADPEFFELDPISVARNAFETDVTTIKTVNVTDGDGDMVTLTVPTDQTYFSVNGRDIEVAASLMSLSGTYTLTITATDDGVPPRSTEAILTIILINTECDRGTYGTECTSQCNSKCPNTCDKVTGYCSECSLGWKGHYCETECDYGTYGLNCTADCGHCQTNTFCHKVTGICESGCMKGYTGATCHDAEEDPEVPTPLPIATIAGTSVGVVAIICVTIIVVCVVMYKRRQLQSTASTTKGQMEPETNSISSSYVDLQRHDRMNDTTYETINP